MVTVGGHSLRVERQLPPPLYTMAIIDFEILPDHILKAIAQKLDVVSHVRLARSGRLGSYLVSELCSGRAYSLPELEVRTVLIHGNQILRNVAGRRREIPLRDHDNLHTDLQKYRPGKLKITFRHMNPESFLHFDSLTRFLTLKDCPLPIVNFYATSIAPQSLIIFNTVYQQEMNPAQLLLTTRLAPVTNRLSAKNMNTDLFSDYIERDIPGVRDVKIFWAEATPARPPFIRIPLPPPGWVILYLVFQTDFIGFILMRDDDLEFIRVRTGANGFLDFPPALAQLGLRAQDYSINRQEFYRMSPED